MSVFDPYSRNKPLTTWSIAGAVCLGVIMANAIEKITDVVMLKIGIEYATYEIQNATQQAKADHEASEQQRRENIAAQQRAQYQAQQAIIDAKTKRETAWLQFYHRDPKCDNNPIDDATFTKCANDSVKAKTIFDATYQP